VLLLLALAQFLMTVDASVMNVSIGALVEDLDTTVTAIQGVITAYTLVMAAGMITGAKIGDLIGRKRALRIGLVIYATGSLITALAPNVTVLLIGWSVLEGIGAALIMPTVVALVAGNFTGKRRAFAYGVIAASAAVAIAAGPIIGGFVTAEFSWRWVFAAEVPIAAAILVGSRAVADAPAAERPKIDLVGAVLSAVGLGLVVIAVVESGAWGWVQPKIPDGPDATPELFGVSAVTWMLVGGLLILWLFVGWIRRRVTRGEEPLFDPALLQTRQITGGLSVLLFQYLVMMGVFFAMPLFLTMVLGLDSFETGLRMLPLSLALVVAAPAIPKLLPHVGPRRVCQAGLLLMLVAVLLLAARFEDGADASVTTLPFILLGLGMGALASQLGNVVVSAVPEERSGEVGGLQYTAQNLGSSLGTALVGSVVIAALSAQFLAGVQGADQLSPELRQEAAVAFSDGVEFVAVDDAKEALSRTDLTPQEQEAIADAYEDAQLGALRNGMLVLALVVLGTLFLTGRLPRDPLIPPDEEAPAPAGTVPDPAGLPG
jgi:EmrB/QacA subfamily drug resistance transporter